MGWRSVFFFSSRRRHTRSLRDWSSDVCSSDLTKKVEPLPLPAPQVRALAGPQVRTVKNVLDRIEGFHQLNGRRHRGGQALAVHRHARPLRDRAIVHLILGTGLRRAEITGIDLDQLDPAEPA